MFCRGYRRVNSLSAAEVNAIPWLTRLRDVVSMDLRLGRALATGDTGRLLNRLQEMQACEQWLRQNGQRLVDVASQEI